MFTVFDIETTGLNTEICDIVQFAYSMFDSDNNFVRAESLYFYYDGMHWDDEVADKTHKFTIDFLQQYKDKFRENCIRMFTVLNEANVIGHNSENFDVPFVTRWLCRRGLPYLQPSRTEDTMLFMRPLSKRTRIKLTKLTGLCGIEDNAIKTAGKFWFGEQFANATAHNAMYDVAATSLITLLALKENYIDFSSEKSAVPTSTLNVRIPINNISKEWLDQNHVHYCALKSIQGVSYVGTCDAPHQFEPETYKSLDAMAPEAQARLLPLDFCYVDGKWQWKHGEISLYMENVHGVVRLVLKSGYIDVTSDTMPYAEFVKVVRAIYNTTLLK